MQKYLARSQNRRQVKTYEWTLARACYHLMPLGDHRGGRSDPQGSPVGMGGDLRRVQLEYTTALKMSFVPLS